MSSKKNVFVASIATETNTFSPLRTDLRDFRDSFYAEPGQHPETPTLCSAVFSVARQQAQAYGWRVIEGTATWAEPGGLVNGETWRFLRDQLLEELKAAMPVDIVLLGLHGAMVAQDCLDCEGELLRMVREHVGPNVIIGATLDPHSHLSKRRTDNADLLVAFKEFPHTDFVIAAENLCALAAKAASGRIRPALSVFDCRMIEVLPTSREPMRGFVDRMKALEGQGNILSISTIHGFMAGDVPDLGTKIMVLSDNDRTAGNVLAEKLGMELFGYRGMTRPEFLTPDDGLDRATRPGSHPVVVTDVWDNPGGGVPGDSTILLHKILKRRLKNVAFATIWDPIAVRTCFSAGEGARLRLRFGGKMSDKAGAPVDANVLIRRLVPSATQSFGSSIVPLGDSVWIEVEGVQIVLNTVRSQVFNPDLFSNMGIDPADMDILFIKSTNHFYDAFAPMAAEIIYVAVDGPYPNNPKTNAYRNLRRAIWPRVDNPHTQDPLEEAS